MKIVDWPVSNLYNKFIKYEHVCVGLSIENRLMLTFNAIKLNTISGL